MMRAAIAIGSNSTRLLAAEKRDGVLCDILRGREETRLFLGLDEEGNIRPERLESTAQAVLRLAAMAWQHGAENIDLFATSATRDAKNGGALADRIFSLCGLRLRVISGQEEAALAFRAVSEGQRRLVMDIGGGSTEFTVGENNVPQWSVSMQLGASRLLKMGEINSPADAEKTLDIARRIMVPYAAQYRALPPAPALVGGGSGHCSSASTRDSRTTYRVSWLDMRSPYRTLTLSTMTCSSTSSFETGQSRVTSTSRAMLGTCAIRLDIKSSTRTTSATLDS